MKGSRMEDSFNNIFLDKGSHILMVQGRVPIAGMFENHCSVFTY
jgi:hypothetical protein